MEMTAAPGDVDADSVVQEALMRAYAARYKYRPEGGFSAWLYAITRNEMYRALNRRRTLPLNATPAAISGNQEETMLKKELIRELRTAKTIIPELVISKIQPSRGRPLKQGIC